MRGVWLYGQAVKTPPSHGGYPGSNPGRVTTKRHLFFRCLSLLCRKSEISMRIWRSPMSATSQGAFVVIPEISLCGISHIITKALSLRSIHAINCATAPLTLLFTSRFICRRGMARFPKPIRDRSPCLRVFRTLTAKMLAGFRRLKICGLRTGALDEFLQDLWIFKHRTWFQEIIVERLPFFVCHKQWLLQTFKQ